VSEARKHHYVPVFYQQNFVNPKGLLWVYDRRLKTCKELNPRSVCFEKEFYTVKRKDAPWERRIETECFGLIDGMGSSAIRELLSASPLLETIRGVSFFMAVQIHRTPSFARIVSETYVAGAEELMRLMTVSVGRMQSVLDRYSQETGESTNISAESMVEAVRERRIRPVATEMPFLHHIFSQAERISEIFEQLDWQVLIAPHNVGFIICDNPAVVVPPEGCPSVGVLVPGTVKYFPLGRQYCLRLGTSSHSFSYRTISKETVQVINRNIAANSERFVMGQDKAQLMSTITLSGSVEQDPTPRFTVEILNADDHGSFQKLTRHPTRYFYVRGIAP
jgi:hypothetical protein